MSFSLALSAVVGGEVLDSHLMMYVNCMCVCVCVCVCACVCVCVCACALQPAARAAVYKRTDISHSTP